jgi:heme exporter protein B
MHDMPRDPAAGATRTTVTFTTPGFLADCLRIARKDLLIEFRTRSAFLAATVFALLSVAIFRFTWDGTAVAAIDLAPPVLWVIFTFSGLLGLNRSFGVEFADRAMDALLASPMSREAVFAGKALANLVFVAAVQALTLPAVALFFDLPSGSGWFGVIAVAMLAAIGLTAVGTLFAAVASNTRLAEMLLPMLALPFFVPVVIPAAQATALLLAGQPLSEATSWIKVLSAFDIVFVAACTVAFPYTLDE